MILLLMTTMTMMIIMVTFRFREFESCCSDGKESACNAGDTGSIFGPGRSPGEGNSYPLQYSCLENSTDRGVWQATVCRVAKNWT